MKKCMQCGGSTKKMQKGGALRTLGSKIGVGVNVAGMIGTGIKAISDRVKAKKAEKKEKEAALDKKQKGGVTKGNLQFYKDGSLKTFESERAKQPKQGGLRRDDKYNKIREDIEKTTGKKSSLKYQKGGIAKQEIVGMPGYNARTDTMKTGGAKKSYKSGGIKKMQVAGAVDRTTPDPMYKTTNDRGDYNTPSRSGSTFTPPPPSPGEGMARKGGATIYKKGGATKKAKLAAMVPPKGKITRADVITAAKRNARKK